MTEELAIQKTYYHAKTRPEIVCLCGSTRFYDEFVKANLKFTLKGKIVLSIGANNHDMNYTLTHEEKTMLDELHKRKIDLADYIYVLNIGGYIGDSTRSEINYAIDHGKKVRYHDVKAFVDSLPKQKAHDPV